MRTSAPTGTITPTGAQLPIWRNRWIGAAAAVAAPGLWGLVAGWWTPRGPVTTSQALAALGISLLVGFVAGVTTRTRWAMLLTAVTFVVVFECTRRGAIGATVDGIHLGSTYGMVAFVLGRGIHAVLTVVPMLLGTVLGVAAVRRPWGRPRAASGRATAGLRTRRAVTVLVAVGLLALTAGIIRPAGTNAILTAAGRHLSGSIAELTRVDIDGHRLAMMIRGDNIAHPVILFLAGGPGGTELGAMRRHGQLLEHEFVVATLDQRGTGKSYDTIDPAASFTLAGAVSDAIGVTKYLRQRFHQDKIYVIGNSWGTILGVLAVQQHPEFYQAYIGTGQMVSPRATDLVFYQDTLDWARRTGDTALAGRLTEAGPPPYTNMLDYEPTLTYEKSVYPYDHSPNSEGAGQMSENLFVGEYSLMEQIHSLGAALDVFTLLYPQLQNIDFRTQVSRLEVPVYLIEGRYEAPGRAGPCREWFDTLSAPSKQLTVFDTAGHRPLFEQPVLFHQFMVDTVLAQTGPVS